MKTVTGQMKRDAPFTKRLAAILAILLLRVSVCGAASLAPGSIAVLQPAVLDPEMRAAWEKASREVCLDPLLLVLNENDVESILEEWRLAGEAVNAAWRLADRSVLERTEALLDEARKAYYAFAFEKALGLLQQAGDLLASPGDSRFRSRIAFEVNILKGMVRRAVGDERFRDEFKNAASVFPAAELPPEEYSPEIISAFSIARNELLSDEPLQLTMDFSPADAEILVDGKISPQAMGARQQVFPGRHFIEAGAPGYEPFGLVLEVGKWDSPSLEFSLVPGGPVGEPGRFFLGRLKAGDRSYLSWLLERLDVDYVLIPDGEEGVLHPWLIGRDGRAVTHKTVWQPGDDPDTAVRNLSAMLEPLRQDGGVVGEPTFALVNLPPMTEAGVEAPGEPEKTTGWKRYAVVLGLVVLVAVATSSDSGSERTSVEVTW